MKRSACFFLTAALFAMFATAANAQNAKAVRKTGGPPSIETLTALEKQADAAFFNGDVKFFTGFLSDKFVAQIGGAQVGKAAFIQMISSVKCDIEDIGSMSGSHLTMVDGDAYILSYRSDTKGTCHFGSDSLVMPGPVLTATVYIRNGEKWDPVFHASNPIVDPAASQKSDAKIETASSELSVANAIEKAVVETAPETTATDPTTKALMAAENTIWTAWMKKDAKRIDALMANDAAFVNIFGTFFASRAEALKDWTGDTCNVKNFALSNGVGTAVTPTVGIVTFTGTVQGICGGADISGQKIYGNTVYVKDGAGWKWVFGFNSPD